MAIEGTTDIRFAQVVSVLDDEGNTLSSAVVAPLAEGKVQVIRLFTSPEHRNQGHATEVMLKIIEHFRNVAIVLQPAPFADKPMSAVDLFEWYMTLDFKAEGDRLIKPADFPLPDNGKPEARMKAKRVIITTCPECKKQEFQSESSVGCSYRCTCGQSIFLEP